MSDVETLKATILTAIRDAGDADALERVRVQALGKKGSISTRMKSLGDLDDSDRRALGQVLNALKDDVSTAIEERRKTLQAAAMEERLAHDYADVTLPARPHSTGVVHPISQTMDEVVAILGDMGLRVAEGPDIEDDWHNFTALNMPPDHPARQEHDTFYLPPDADGVRRVLRTHTSPVQIRTMETTAPPIRIIAPGRTFRCDYDATHSPMFHQIEGLVIDKNIHMGHLKGCLIELCRRFFGVEDLPVRFRPSYFPFTEPSAEVDIGCTRKDGALHIGHGDDWLEILGCGMVNANVLRNCSLDPDQWQGFAFGLGIERFAMLKYGIADLRRFYETDLRWLRHYGFQALQMPSIHGGAEL